MVRILTACCLADILRLYAPEAPYKPQDLRHILMFFGRELGNLKNSNEATSIYYRYFLQDLVQTQSIALVAEVEDNTEIVNTLFSSLFDVLNAGIESDYEFFITNLLSQIIVEVEMLPSAAVKLVLNQFLEQQTAASFRVSKVLAAENTNLLTKMTGMRTAELISEINSSSDESELDEDQLNYLNKLVVGIWQAVPELLESSVSSLESLLTDNNIQLRSISTLTFGQMIQSFPSKVNFPMKYPRIFATWASRARDKDAHIRSTWAASTVHIFNGGGDVPSEIVDGMIFLLQDSSDVVRLEAVESLKAVKSLTSVMSYEKISKMMPCLFDRLRDRKSSIRSYSRELLIDLYLQSYTDILAENKLAIEVMAPIPSKLLELIYINDPRISEEVERSLFERIAPYDLHEDFDHTQRMLVLVKYLSDEAQKVVESICSRQCVLNKALKNILILLKDRTLDRYTKESKLSGWISWLARQLSNSDNVREQLSWMFNVAGTDTLAQIENCLDEKSSYEVISRSLATVKENLLNRQREDIIAPMSTIIFRGGFFIFNVSLIKHLLNIAGDASSLSTAALSVLKYVAYYQPALLQNYMDQIESWILGGVNNRRSDGLKLANLVCQHFAELASTNQAFWKSVKKICLEGNVSDSENSTELLQYGPHKELDYEDLWMIVKDEINNYAGPVKYKLSTLLAVLRVLINKIPQRIEPDAGSLTVTLVDRVIMAQQRSRNNRNEEKLSPEFGKLEDLSEFYLSKVMALKVLITRLSVASNDADSVEQLLPPTMKLLHYLSSKDSSSDGEARLKLEVGISILQLARHKVLDHLLEGSDVQIVADMLYSDFDPIREPLARILAEGISAGAISECRFFPLMYFVKTGNNDQLKEFCETWIRAKIIRGYERRMIGDEDHLDVRSLPVLISHLSHLPQIRDDEHFEPAITIILNYLALTANKNNIAAISYAARRVKSFRDRMSLTESTEQDEEGEESRRLYLISDLADICISLFSEHRGWTVATYSSQFGLPSELFSQFNSSKRLEAVFKTNALQNHLGDEGMIILEESIKKKVAKLRIPKADENNEVFPRSQKRGRQGKPVSFSKEKDGQNSGSFKEVHNAENMRRSSRRRSRAAISYAEASWETDMSEA